MFCICSNSTGALVVLCMSLNSAAVVVVMLSSAGSKQHLVGLIKIMVIGN